MEKSEIIREKGYAILTVELKSVTKWVATVISIGRAEKKTVTPQHDVVFYADEGCDLK